MKHIKMIDVTMQAADKRSGHVLSFREKIELAKLLDKLGVDVIAMHRMENAKIDSLLIKSVASAVKQSAVAVPVSLDETGVDAVWAALKEAKAPRLQVIAPVSSVQMEYLAGKKPAAMLEAVEKTLRRCASLCRDVEFVADDATRADAAFLHQILELAVSCGATTVTVCDAAGSMLPNEFGAFVQSLYQAVPALSQVALGVGCSNALSMADACALSAVRVGAEAVRAAAYPANTVSLSNVVKVLSAKSAIFDAQTQVRATQMQRILDQIAWMCSAERGKSAAVGGAEGDSDVFLTVHDDMSAVAKAVAALGYDLSEEDVAKVFEAFTRIASKKESVGQKELDAIVASAALQVPPTYRLENYVITTGNTISATAHMRLLKNGQMMEGVTLGDGPIDASFMAIEQIVGHHYELDDFQIQSVTEGREAMGEAVVKLRSAGKLYSGRGISTDIVGASIHAFLSALNKIVYEEAVG